MVVNKDLYLASSIEELTKKASDVAIEEKTPVDKLLRYVRSTEQIYISAETMYSSGDQEKAYVYYMKYFHVQQQIRSTHAYTRKDGKLLKEMERLIPTTKCKQALIMAEKLAKSLEKRYKSRREALEKEIIRQEEMRAKEEERAKEIRRIEEMKISDSRPSIDAVELFCMNNSTLAAPLLPMGQSAKDLIPKEPYISPIELMHIIESNIKVLVIDIRTLDYYKESHSTHTTQIFISKDYLNHSSRLTPAEIRDLIVIKDHRALWDKRSSFDLIVIWDDNSTFNDVTDTQMHPINQIRDCSLECLDPNFMNSDLPKVLDGGYESWVHHFPKSCTNPDKVTAKVLKPKVTIKRTTTTVPLSRSLSDVKAASIYPTLNKDAEPKPTLLTKEKPEQKTQVVDTTPSVVINMQQTPQTIQINQWSDSGKDAKPPSPLLVDARPKPFSSHHTVLDGKSNKGSFKVTDVYIEPPNNEITPSPSNSNGYVISDPNNLQSRTSEQYRSPSPVETVTTFPVKPKQPSLNPPQSLPPPQISPDPVYAQIEPRKPIAAVSAVLPKQPSVEYADITSVRRATNSGVSVSSTSTDSISTNSITSPPLIDRSKKPPSLEGGSKAPSSPRSNSYSSGVAHQHPAPHPTSANANLLPAPTHSVVAQRRPKSEEAKPPPQSVPVKPQQPPSNRATSQNSQLHPEQIQPRAMQTSKPIPTQVSQPSIPQKPKHLSSKTETRSNEAVVANPVVNRVIKPLSSKDVEAKLLRMNPTHGSVQMGTCGLKNIGNTCFMNAVLQCLAATAPLTSYFMSDQYKTEINSVNTLGTQGLVAEEYAFLLKAMWSGNFRHLAPKDWKDAIGHFRPQFLDFSQKDSQEFTSFMLDALHEDLNRVRQRPKPVEIDVSTLPYQEGSKKAWECYKRSNDSIIVDLFQGQFRSITQCRQCGFESVTFDTFMYLTVPVEQSKTTLKSCIENFCKAELIEWRCSKCKRMGKAVKNLTIWRLPLILVVILKRFSYSGMWRDKITTYVDFPTKDFHINYATYAWMSNRDEDRVYRLYGVTNHTGTLDGGHYIGCSRNPISGDWFTYDDHVIRPMKVDSTKKKEAYLLFYTSLTENEDKMHVKNFRR